MASQRQDTVTVKLKALPSRTITVRVTQHEGLGVDPGAVIANRVAITIVTALPAPE